MSDLLRNLQLLIEQYRLRQGFGYGTPERQEQQRLPASLGPATSRRSALIDAYQLGVIELDDLKE